VRLYRRVYVNNSTEIIQSGSGGASSYGDNQTIRLTSVTVTTTASSTTAPTTQASDISFTDITTNSMTVNWTNGDGANRAVFVKEEAGSITNPTDGTTYTASADWATKGDQLGTSGYYCVYNGTGNSVGLTNLDLSKSYTVQIFEYNGDSGEEAYFTDAATSNPNTHAPVLPISLTSFKATAQTNGIQLNWATSSENNANKFVVERKSADTDFANLIEIKAKGQASNYAITDKNVASGETYYYRLKMVDNDGSFSYSNVSSAKFSIETSKLTAVYPNPATHSITVSYPETGNTVSSLTITDTKGSVVLTAVIPTNSTQQTIDVSGLKTGIYIININTNEGRKTLKLVKN